MSCGLSTGCHVRCGPGPERSSDQWPSWNTSCTGVPTEEELAAKVDMPLEQLLDALAEMSTLGLVALDELLSPDRNSAAVGDLVPDRKGTEPGSRFPDRRNEARFSPMRSIVCRNGSGWS